MISETGRGACAIPASTKMTSSAAASASLGSWVIVITVAPFSCTKAEVSASISARNAGPSAANGSSSKTSGFACANTRARAARLCCPPKRPPAFDPQSRRGQHDPMQHESEHVQVPLVARMAAGQGQHFVPARDAETGFHPETAWQHHARAAVPSSRRVLQRKCALILLEHSH